MGRQTGAAAGLAYFVQEHGQLEATEIAYGRVNTNYVFGVLVVKDWRGNTHLIRIVNSEIYHVHAEDAMYDILRKEYGSTGIPFDAKIIFYVTKSPCRKCVGNMIDQIFGLYETISGGRQLYFSFVYHKFYLQSTNDSSNKAQHNAWNTPQEAVSAYNQLELEADSQGQEAFRRVGVITIRHISETKGGDGKHRPIVYAYGIS